MRRNPLKSGQCFLPIKRSYKEAIDLAAEVAIPSNRVNVSYFLEFPVSSNTLELACVAIPSNRVNVSYINKNSLHLP